MKPDQKATIRLEYKRAFIAMALLFMPVAILAEDSKPPSNVLMICMDALKDWGGCRGSHSDPEEFVNLANRIEHQETKQSIAMWLPKDVASEVKQDGGQRKFRK